MQRVLLFPTAMMLVVSGFARLASAQTAPNPTPTSDAQPLAVLLEQGIYQEETAGNLDAAAKTYRQIADQAAVGRALVAQALSRLVALQVKQKQLDDARQTLERLKTEYPEQKDVIAKAVALLPRNEQKPILAGGDQSEKPEQSEHIPTAEEKAKAAELAKQGWEQYRDGKNETAAEAFRRAAQLDPKSIDALNGLGWTLLNAHKPGGGQCFGKVLQVDPKNAMALNGMGWTMWNQSTGSKPNAIKYWQQAVEVDPAATSPMSGLAQNALETNKFDEAVNWYEKWLDQDPKSLEASKGLERAKAGQKDVNDAMPIALEFLKSVDQGRLEDAKRLTESGDYVLSDQDNMRIWQSLPGNAPVAFSGSSAVKSEKWGEMMKELRDPFGTAFNRKLESLRGASPRSTSASASTSASPFASPTFGRGVSSARGRMVLHFTTEFENSRRATEYVTLQKTKDDDWKIHGYGITKPVSPRDPLKSE